MASPSINPRIQLLTEDVHAPEVRQEWVAWKKRSVRVYEYLLAHTLLWPSLTVEWLPEKTIDTETGYSEHKIIFGTQTSGDESNFLNVADVRMPLGAAEIGPDDEPEDYGTCLEKVRIVQQIPHEGEINRARHMPQNSSLIATKPPKGEVHVFDRLKHAAIPPNKTTKPRPLLRLLGHKEEGYGVDWSKVREGYLCSGSDDATVCVWDIRATHGAKRSMHPLITFSEHTANVEDVRWHPRDTNMLASVGDDCQCMLWDMRNARKPSHRARAHDADVNCLAFNPHTDFHFLTGSADKTLKLWDLRKLEQHLHSFHGHRDDVFQAAWNPEHPTMFASGGQDRRVMLWDISRIGEKEDNEAPPELMFIHGGHTDKVADLSWSLSDPWVVASVGEDNILQVWSIAEQLRRHVPSMNQSLTS